MIFERKSKYFADHQIPMD
jgi:hypothetical protein